MKLPDDLHVLVTGTSGAIGGAVARELKKRRPGARLTLVDRVAGERLAAELGAAAVVADLARTDELPGLVERAERERGPLDGLVSCAGFMEVRRVESLPWPRAYELLLVDLVAPLRLLHLVAGGMIERRRGFVVNVTSMAGRVPLKGCAFYGAAKAGLSMASEITRVELKGRGVQVVTVYPGPVASALERAARAQYGGGMLSRAVPAGRPERLARRIVDAVERGRARVIYPALYEVGWHAQNLAAWFALAAGPPPAA
jgi:short-subunit dehydrogenase